MDSNVSKLLALSLLGGAFSTSLAVAQDAPKSAFAAPVRLMAGKKPLGDERLFPSPVWRDMNGDGLADIVVGDLIGRLTVALRLPDSKPAAYGPEEKLKDLEGKEIDFHNW